MGNVKAIGKIIGISGKAGAGKDTVAARLIAHHQFTKVAFADALKAGAREMFSLSREQTDGALKEIVDPRYDKSPRQIMQLLGTEFGRNLIHPEVWIRACRARIDAYAAAARFVIPDVRFPNEAEAVRAWGGEVWRVERPGIVAVNVHPSESALDGFDFDWKIGNDSTIENLHAVVDVFAHLR